jgi:hypothetical protein
MAHRIPHVLETFEALEWGSNGYERVLHVVTDLRLAPGAPGFDAERRYALAQQVGKLLEPDSYTRAEVHYKPPRA